MIRSTLKAAVAYAAIAFAAGFVLGTVRVLIVAPRLGAPLAMLLEAPVMLAVSWAACTACIRAARLPRTTAAGLLTGGTAFLLLQAAEMALAAVAFGRSPQAYLGDLATLAGTEGLAAQVAFGLFPVIQVRLRARPIAGRPQ
jgi:hypothetical protein